MGALPAKLGFGGESRHICRGLKRVLSSGIFRRDGAQTGESVCRRRLPEDCQKISVWQETGVHKLHDGVYEFTLSSLSEVPACLRAGGRLPGPGGTGEPPLWDKPTSTRRHPGLLVLFLPGKQAVGGQCETSPARILSSDPDSRAHPGGRSQELGGQEQSRQGQPPPSLGLAPSARPHPPTNLLR